MVDYSTVLDFVYKTRDSDNLSEVKAQFSKIIAEMGFHTFSCVSYVDFNAPPEGAVTIIEYDREFFSRYKEKHYEEHDRILKIALREFHPFVWTSEKVQKGMTKNQKAIFDDASSVQMLQGVTVPIHKRGAFPGSVNVVGENVDINFDNIPLIQLLGIYLHEFALRHYETELFEKRHLGKHLTGSERECLRWVCIGKTDSEIGEILSKSERTVHHQIESAKRKLGATSRPQAVLLAYMQNQLQP